MDLVSVVIPTKDRYSQLSRAVESVMNQSYENTEIIIIDDGSTDKTEDLIAEMKRNSKFPILYRKNSTSLGGAVSRNRGSEIASGEYIAFLDSDDEWKADHLKEALFFLKNKPFNGCFSDYSIVNGEETTLVYENKIEEKQSMIDLFFSRKIDPRTSTFVFEKKKFDAVKFDEQQKKHQDWDLMLRFSKKFKMGLTEKNNVVIHHDAGNRMSAKMYHPATEYFLGKHLKDASSDAGIVFLTFLSWRTVVLEGKKQGYTLYKKYINRLLETTPTLRKEDKVKLFILRFPASTVQFVDFLWKKRLS